MVYVYTLECVYVYSIYEWMLLYSAYNCVPYIHIQNIFYILYRTSCEPTVPDTPASTSSPTPCRSSLDSLRSHRCPLPYPPPCRHPPYPRGRRPRYRGHSLVQEEGLYRLNLPLLNLIWAMLWIYW